MQGWRLLSQSESLSDVREALSLVNEADFLQNRSQIGRVSETFKSGLKARGWAIDLRPPGGGSYTVIDAVKNKVGIEFFTAPNTAVPLRAILATLPACKFADMIDVALVLVSTSRLGANGSRATYDSTVRVLKELMPVRLPLPLVVAGYSENPADIIEEHLTTELDYYLQKRVGLDLNQIAYKGEHQAIEFKRELPEDPKAVARELCALANEPDGGLLLIGVSDDGTLVGVENVDEIDQRLQNIIRANCAGLEALTCIPITFSENGSKVVLAVEIHVAESRPAMTGDRVPIRAGTTVRYATAEEIRRMVIADL